MLCLSQQEMDYLDMDYQPLTATENTENMVATFTLCMLANFFLVGGGRAECSNSFICMKAWPIFIVQNFEFLILLGLSEN